MLFDKNKNFVWIIIKILGGFAAHVVFERDFLYVIVSTFILEILYFIFFRKKFILARRIFLSEYFVLGFVVALLFFPNWRIKFVNEWISDITGRSKELI